MYSNKPLLVTAGWVFATPLLAALMLFALSKNSVKGVIRNMKKAAVNRRK